MNGIISRVVDLVTPASNASSVCIPDAIAPDVVLEVASLDVAGEFALPARTVLRLTRHRDLRSLATYVDSIERVERIAPVPALRC